MPEFDIRGRDDKNEFFKAIIEASNTEEAREIANHRFNKVHVVREIVPESNQSEFVVANATEQTDQANSKTKGKAISRKHMKQLPEVIRRMGFGKLFNYLYRVAVLLVLVTIAWQLYDLRVGSVNVWVENSPSVNVSSLPGVKVKSLPYLGTLKVSVENNSLHPIPVSVR